MKVSVSLSKEDLAALDRYVQQSGLGSRSAAVQQAIRRLEDPQMEADYAAAWDEWAMAGDEDAWASASSDWLSDAAQ